MLETLLQSEFIPFLIFMGFISLGFILFWLWMLIDCLLYNDSEYKFLWLAVIVFGFIAGAILYFAFQSEYSKFSPRCKIKKIKLFG